MTYVYLNYDNIKSVVKSISDYADNAASAKAAAAAINFAHHFVVDLSGIAGWDEKVQSLRDKGKEIDNRVELAKHQSENGLSPKQGVDISYYVPDGVDDTVDNVQNASWAMDDAKLIEDVVNGSSPARFDDPKYKAARERAEQRAQDPAYAAGFVEKYGLTDLLHMPEEARIEAGNYKTSPDADISFVANMVSHASQTWSEEESKKKSEEVSGWVNGVGKFGRASELNAVLQVEGMKYGNDFLVSLADRMEDINWTPEWDTGGMGAKQVTGKTLEGYSTDPLLGVLTAMKSNPDAALNYFASKGRVDANGNWAPSDETKKRWEKLSTRRWGDEGENAFTAAQAAASGFRNLSPEEVKGVKNADSRATWLAGRTIELYSSDKYSDNRLSDASKKNLAMVLANSPEEIDGIASGSLNELAQGPKLSNDQFQITKLLYRVLDNEDAAATLAANMGEHHRTKIDNDMEASESFPRDDRLSVLQNDYKRAAQTQSFLSELAKQHYADNKELNEEKQKTVDTTASIFSAVAVGAASIGSAGAASPVAAAVIPTVAGVVAEGAKPIASAAAMTAIADPTSPDEKATVPAQDILETQAYSDAAKRSLFDKEETNKSATSNGIVLNDGQERLPINSKQTSKVQGWEQDVSVARDDSVRETSESITTGMNDGVHHAQTYLPKDNR